MSSETRVAHDPSAMPAPTFLKSRRNDATVRAALTVSTASHILAAVSLADSVVERGLAVSTSGASGTSVGGETENRGLKGVTPPAVISTFLLRLPRRSS